MYIYICIYKYIYIYVSIFIAKAVLKGPLMPVCVGKAVFKRPLIPISIAKKVFKSPPMRSQIRITMRSNTKLTYFQYLNSKTSVNLRMFLNIDTTS